MRETLSEEEKKAKLSAYQVVLHDIELMMTGYLQADPQRTT
jgi:hypothetical protein